MENFHRDAEGGAYQPNPSRADLIGLITGLNQTDNTFIVIHPNVDDADWIFSISTTAGAFGGYELRCYDPEPARTARPPQQPRCHRRRRTGLDQPTLAGPKHALIEAVTTRLIVHMHTCVACLGSVNAGNALR